MPVLLVLEVLSHGRPRAATPHTPQPPPVANTYVQWHRTEPKLGFGHARIPHPTLCAPHSCRVVVAPPSGHCNIRANERMSFRRPLLCPRPTCCRFARRIRSKSRKQKQSQNSSSARLSSARGVHANALRTSLSIHGRVYPLAWASAATQWTLLLHATLSEFSNLPSFMYEWPPRRHRTQKQGYASSLHTPLLQCSPPNSQSHPARKQLMNTNRNRNRNYAPRMFGYSSNHSRCGVRTRWRRSVTPSPDAAALYPCI